MVDAFKEKKILRLWNRDFDKELSYRDISREMIHLSRRFVFLRDEGNKRIFYDKFERKEINGKDIPDFEFKDETSLHRDLKKLVSDGKLERRKIKGVWNYRLSEKYKIEPLKLFHKEIINKCNAHNLIPTNSLFFYMPENLISDFTYDELAEIKGIEIDLMPHFADIQNIMEKVCRRKANMFWKESLRKSNIIGRTRFLAWLYLIRSMICDDTINRLFFRDEGLSYYRQEFNGLHEHPKRQMEFVNDSVKRWNDKFDKLFFDAISNVFDGLSLDLDSMHQLLEGIINGVNEILYDKPFFLSVADSYNLNFLQYGDVEKYYPAKIQSIKFINEELINLMERKTVEDDGQSLSFFRNNDFLEGCEVELESLQCSKEKLYDELDFWADIFTVPKLPNI